MLPSFGVDVARGPLSATVRGGARLRGTDVEVPGDASSAAFLVVAALVLPDSEVRLDGVLPRPDAHGVPGGAPGHGGEGRGPRRIDRPGAGRLDRGLLVPPARHGRRPRPRPLAHRRGAGPRRRPPRSRRGRSPSPAPPSCGSRRATASPRWPRASPPSGRACGSSPTAWRSRAGAGCAARGSSRTATTASPWPCRWPRSAADGATEVEDGDCVAVSFPEFYSLLGRATGRG